VLRMPEDRYVWLAWGSHNRHRSKNGLLSHRTLDLYHPSCFAYRRCHRLHAIFFEILFDRRGPFATEVDEDAPQGVDDEVKESKRRSKSETSEDDEIDMTPAEAFISFLGMTLVQIAIGVVLITILDRRQCPVLSETGRGQLPPETSAPDTLLEVKGLVHSYGWLPSRSSPETFTLHGVSFKIDRGETLGLLGPNGAGKTTAIRCITGEEGPQKGSVSIGAEAGGACIGLCPQETVINGDLTVAENLLFFAYVRGAQGDRAKRCVNEILRATRLEEKQRDLPDALSGGMRRRLAVGCAMIATPSVVVLDEPTTGLDPVSRRGIWQTIAEADGSKAAMDMRRHFNANLKAAQGPPREIRIQAEEGHL
ncbi:nodI, partial [Symbiodinium microadriaticum]